MEHIMLYNSVIELPLRKFKPTTPEETNYPSDLLSQNRSSKLNA